MKRTASKITGIALSVSLLLSAAAASAPAVSAAAAHSVTLSFSGTVNFYGNRDILQQYACQNGESVKLLNGRTLYRYDVSQDTFTVEHTFPAQAEINSAAGQTGTVRVYDGVQSAYVNEKTGRLYYAYDKYQRFNKREGMAVEVVTYDMERAKVISTATFPGENLMAVGADNSGNIFLSVRRQFDEIGNDTALIVSNQKGAGSVRKVLENPIDTFCGFADDGRFFFTETKYVMLENGRFRVERGMNSGTFVNQTLQTGAVFSNINYYYNQPAKLLDGGYLANYTTRLYNAQTMELTDYFPATPVSEQDSYYTGHNTANAAAYNGVVYVLRNSHKITGYRMDSKILTDIYSTDDAIFSMIPCGDGLMLLLKNGSAYRYRYVPFADFTKTGETVLNLNELDIYQRTPAAIIQQFAQSVPADYDADFYAVLGSANAPYREYVLTEETKENLVRAASYYRWLEGLSGFTAADAQTWSNAAKGAVLTDKNVRLTRELSHYPERPADMDTDFYEAGYAATSSSNIAYGFSDGQHAIIDLLRGFLNDEGYVIPGHRDTFMTRNADRFAAGYTDYGAVNTIQYTGNPNPMGYSESGNNRPAYAWPTPGAFPVEEICTNAVWTINLNTDYATFSSRPMYVKITDVQTGETFMRNSPETGLYATNSWGKFISFLPPEASSYSGKQYQVEVFNLADADGAPVRLTYTVNFFSYTDPVEINGETYVADEYGVLTLQQPPILLGDVNEDGKVTVNDVTQIQRWLSEQCTFSDTQCLAADADGDGNITISDCTLIQRYLAEFITHF